MIRLAMIARQAKIRPHVTEVVGLTGRAETAIGPGGTIFVRGELWPAHSPVNIARGETVRVTGITGLTLDVHRST